MQKILVVVVLPLLLAGLMASEAMAGASASMTITIRVMPINVVGIDPIGPLVVGQTGTTDLKWSTNEDGRKILVRLDHLPVFLKALKVAAEPSFFGQFAAPPTSRGEVILDSLQERELVLAPRGAGGCKVKYAAVADPGKVFTEPEMITVIYIFATADNSPLMAEYHFVLVMPEASFLAPDSPAQTSQAVGDITYLTITDTGGMN